MQRILRGEASGAYDLTPHQPVEGMSYDTSLGSATFTASQMILARWFASNRVIPNTK
jgi:hypothetical protein